MHIITRILVAFALVFVGFVIVPVSAEAQEAGVDGRLDRADLEVIGGWASSPDPSMNFALVRIVGRFYLPFSGSWAEVTLMDGLASNFRPDVGQKSFTFSSPAWWFKGWATEVCAQVADYRYQDDYGNPTWYTLPGCTTIIARTDGDKRPAVSAKIMGRGETLDYWTNNASFQLLRIDAQTEYQSWSNWATGNCFVNRGDVSCWEASWAEGSINLPVGNYLAVVEANGYRTKFVPFRFEGQNLDLGTINLDPMLEVSLFRQDLLGAETVLHVDLEHYQPGGVDVVLQVYQSTGVDSTYAVTFDADKKSVDRVGRTREELRFSAPQGFPSGLGVSWRVVVTPKGNPWSVLGEVYGFTRH